MTDESKIRDVADATRGLLESEVVHDALHPASQEVGKALQTVGKAVNVALAPVGALIWGYDKIRDWLVAALEDRLSSTPPDRIVPPQLTIAGPAIEALRFAGNEESLRELYANLLATAMDSETAHTAHPAFVEIIRQLSPDEAKLLSYIAREPAFERCFVDVQIQMAERGSKATVLSHFSVLAEAAGCAFHDLSASYLDNLARLGIVQLVPEAWWASDEAAARYNALSEHPRVKALIAQFESTEGYSPNIAKGSIEITTLGNQFLAACIMPDTGAE
jgi:hypothetical protein